jgi:MFS family permease
LRRVAVSGLLGTTVEFYDFLVYGTVAALVFGDLFFPQADPAVGTIAAFGTFAAGYLARPLGGIVFGHFGDRIGRKSMMLLTMVLMGSGSFLIGLLPTYDAIGVWAPVLLVALRVVQGIAIGGEWGGAMLMVVEHAEHTQGSRRGLWSSFTQLGAPLGSVLSAGVVTLVAGLPDDEFRSWGWRVPFLLSIVLLAVGLFVRLKVAESPLFAQAKREPVDKPPIVELLRRPKPVLLAACVGIGAFTTQSLLTSFMISYAVDEGYTRPQVLTAVTVASCVALAVLPAASALSDRVGRRPGPTAPSPRPRSPSPCWPWSTRAPPACSSSRSPSVTVSPSPRCTGRSARCSPRCSAPASATPAPPSATRRPPWSAPVSPR